MSEKETILKTLKNLLENAYSNLKKKMGKRTPEIDDILNNEDVKKYLSEHKEKITAEYIHSVLNDIDDDYEHIKYLNPIKKKISAPPAPAPALALAPPAPAPVREPGPRHISSSGVLSAAATLVDAASRACEEIFNDFSLDLKELTVFGLKFSEASYNYTLNKKYNDIIEEMKKLGNCVLEIPQTDIEIRSKFCKYDKLINDITKKYEDDIKLVIKEYNDKIETATGKKKRDEVQKLQTFTALHNKKKTEILNRINILIQENKNNIEKKILERLGMLTRRNLTNLTKLEIHKLFEHIHKNTNYFGDLISRNFKMGDNYSLNYSKYENYNSKRGLEKGIKETLESNPLAINLYVDFYLEIIKNRTKIAHLSIHFNSATDPKKKIKDIGDTMHIREEDEKEDRLPILLAKKISTDATFFIAPSNSFSLKPRTQNEEILKISAILCEILSNALPIDFRGGSIIYLELNFELSLFTSSGELKKYVFMCPIDISSEILNVDNVVEELKKLDLSYDKEIKIIEYVEIFTNINKYLISVFEDYKNDFKKYQKHLLEKDTHKKSKEKKLMIGETTQIPQIDSIFPNEESVNYYKKYIKYKMKYIKLKKIV
jgi:hypothetical protein